MRSLETGRFEKGIVPHNKMEKITHGDHRMYWRGCRCEDCIKANTVHCAHRKGNITLEEAKILPCKTCGINSRMEKRRVCRSCSNEESRLKMLLKHTGITQEKRDELTLEQDNLCAICGNPETATFKATGRVRELAVDHCHETGKIRGLLCSRHNAAIGLFGDDIELLQAAIEYLKRSK